jgi:hypothetical protein
MTRIRNEKAPELRAFQAADLSEIPALAAAKPGQAVRAERVPDLLPDYE